MAVGTPVICSDIPVFREVYDQAAIYFDSRDSKDLTEKVQLIIHNSELRVKMIKKGLEQSKKYSWEKMAKETLKVYKSV